MDCDHDLKVGLDLAMELEMEMEMEMGGYPSVHGLWVEFVAYLAEGVLFFYPGQDSILYGGIS